MAAGLTGRSLSLVGRPMPHERLATHPSVSLDEADARFRHLSCLCRTLGINGTHAPASPGGGLMTVLDRARPGAGPWAAPNGAALTGFA